MGVLRKGWRTGQIYSSQLPGFDRFAPQKPVTLRTQHRYRDEEEIFRRSEGPECNSPAVSAKILSTIEFTFGLFLTGGFMTPLSCIMLMGMMVVALITTVLPGVKKSSFVAWLAEFLYLPEVLCLVILFWLLLAGPGRASVDYLAGISGY